MFDKIKETKAALMSKDGCNCHTKSMINPQQLGCADSRHTKTATEFDIERGNYGYTDLVPDKTNPAHYSIGDEQVWDFIARKKLDYFEGNVVKYVCRSPYKGEQIQDLKKAIAYLRKKIELVEAQSRP